MPLLPVDSCEQFAMWHAKPGVRFFTPLTPTIDDFRDVCVIESLFFGLLEKNCTCAAIGLSVAPPAACFCVCVIPYRGRDLRICDACGVCPCSESSACIWLRAVGISCCTISLSPTFYLRHFWIPAHGPVIGITRGNESAGFADSNHFPQGSHRIFQVLQNLMSMHDVERFIFKRQVQDISKLKAGRDIKTGSGFGSCSDKWQFDVFNAYDLPRSDHRSQIQCDRSWTATNIQEMHSGFQICQKIRSRICSSTRTMRSKSTTFVSVCVSSCWGFFHIYAVMMSDV